MNVDIMLELMFSRILENATQSDREVYQLLIKQYPNVDISSAFKETQERVRTDPECRTDVENILVKYINMLIDDKANNNVSINNMPVNTVENAIDDLFSVIRQGQAMNQITKMNALKRDNLTPDPLTGALKITTNDGDFILEIEHFNETAGVSTTTWQLLDALIQELTNNGMKSPKVRLSLSDYMNMRGLNDIKSAREQVKRELNTISHIRFHFQEIRRGKKRGGFMRLAILGTNGLENGFIVAVFDTQFFEIIQSYNIMQYPLLLYKINAHINPNSWYFGRKITEHKNMNYFKPNADIISVETLLNSSPAMPTYEEVAQTNRDFKSRIIKPFERDMDALDETLTWEYCHNNGKPSTDEELEILYNDNKETPSYNIFIKLLVKITWRYYPIRIEPPKKRTRKSPAIAL